MNLHDLTIPYTHLSRKVLELRTKPSLILALRLYGGGYTERALTQTWTPYRVRQHNTALRELEDRDIISGDFDGNGAPFLNDIRDGERVTVPTEIPWDTFTLAEAKVIIACYREARYKRSPYFTVVTTLESLATVAGVSRRSAATALDNLQATGYLRATKRIAQGRGAVGTTITLMDRESGATLHSLAVTNHEVGKRLLPIEIYRIALAKYDPRNQVSDLRGYISGHQVICPFCLRPDRTFRFACTATEDQWKCFKCGKKGNAHSLYARLRFEMWKDESFRVTVAKIKATIGQDADEADLLTEEPLNEQQSA
jgi:hypothetical protein